MNPKCRHCGASMLRGDLTVRSTCEAWACPPNVRRRSRDRWRAAGAIAALLGLSAAALAVVAGAGLAMLAGAVHLMRWLGAL